jgi:CBS-domain-containing membrane protein
MIVAELMSKDVMTVLPETNLADAARMMLAKHVSGLPVVDAHGALVGMVTEGDLLRRSELQTEGAQPSWLKTFLMPSMLAADYVRTHGRHVAEVMSHNPLVVAPSTALSEITDIMRRKHIKRLPVVENGKLVGVIARSDLLGALAMKLIETCGKPSDAAITEHIKTELAHERWAPKSGIRVNVVDAVVELDGVVFSDNERRAVKVIAENAPGVKEVNDHLVYVDPGSGMAIPAG